MCLFVFHLVVFSEYMDGVFDGNDISGPDHALLIIFRRSVGVDSEFRKDAPFQFIVVDVHGVTSFRVTLYHGPRAAGR